MHNGQINHLSMRGGYFFVFVQTDTFLFENFASRTANFENIFVFIVGGLKAKSLTNMRSSNTLQHDTKVRIF